jgi:hypothetical protein
MRPEGQDRPSSLYPSSLQPFILKEKRRMCSYRERAMHNSF